MPRHEEQATFAYGSEELFAVVAAVEDYPSFVPWCSGARIIREDQQEITADLVIGFGPSRRASRAKLHWIDRDN
jgi:coenzyme Q-binding protein COQ10